MSRRGRYRLKYSYTQQKWFGSSSEEGKHELQVLFTQGGERRERQLGSLSVSTGFAVLFHSSYRARVWASASGELRAACSPEK